MGLYVNGWKIIRVGLSKFNLDWDIGVSRSWNEDCESVKTSGSIVGKFGL